LLVTSPSLIVVHRRRRLLGDGRCGCFILARGYLQSSSHVANALDNSAVANALDNSADANAGSLKSGTCTVAEGFGVMIGGCPRWSGVGSFVRKAHGEH
jgi:hypothetical protein